MAAFSRLKPTMREDNANKMQEILTRDFMSSEESEYEDARCDDGTVTRRKVRFVVRELPWERTKLKKIKKVLDDEHKRKLSPHALSMTKPREVGAPSDRVKPTGPMWAVRTDGVTEE